MSEIVMNEDSNFEDMSIEELEDFIDKANGETPDEEQGEQETENTDSETQDSNDQEETDTSEVEGTEDTTQKPTEETDQNALNEKPYYKGKSREELINMIENGTKKISYQENEIVSLRNAKKAKIDTEYTELQSTIEDKRKKLYESVDPEQADQLLNLVEDVISSKLKEKERLTVEQVEARRQEAYRSNDDFYKALGEIDPEGLQEFLNVKQEEVGKDREGTLYKENWMKEEYKKWKSSKAPNSAPKPKVKEENIIRKKVSASAVANSGSSAQLKQPVNVDNLSADDFLNHWNSNNPNLKI